MTEPAAFNALEAIKRRPAWARDFAALVKQCRALAGERTLYEADLAVAFLAGRRDPEALLRLAALAEKEARRLRGHRHLAQSDAMQMVLERLLVGGPDAPPKLQLYKGIGPLSAFLRVSLVRELTRPRGAAPEQPQVSVQDHVERLIAAGIRREFAVRFPAAVERLTARQRFVLRFHYLDGRSVDDLAKTQGEHRVTASRWLSDARATLRQELLSSFEGALEWEERDEATLWEILRAQPEVSVNFL